MVFTHLNHWGRSLSVSHNCFQTLGSLTVFRRGSEISYLLPWWGGECTGEPSSTRAGSLIPLPHTLGSCETSVLCHVLKPADAHILRALLSSMPSVRGSRLSPFAEQIPASPSTFHLQTFPQNLISGCNLSTCYICQFY